MSKSTHKWIDVYAYYSTLQGFFAISNPRNLSSSIPFGEPLASEVDVCWLSPSQNTSNRWGMVGMGFSRLITCFKYRRCLFLYHFSGLRLVGGSVQDIDPQFTIKICSNGTGGAIFRLAAGWPKAPADEPSECLSLRNDPGRDYSELQKSSTVSAVFGLVGLSSIDYHLQFRNRL